MRSAASCLWLGLVLGSQLPGGGQEPGGKDIFLAHFFHGMTWLGQEPWDQLLAANGNRRSRHSRDSNITQTWSLFSVVNVNKNLGFGMHICGALSHICLTTKAIHLLSLSSHLCKVGTVAQSFCGDCLWWFERN